MENARKANLRRKAFRGGGRAGNRGGAGVVGNRGGAGVVGNRGNSLRGHADAGRRSGLRRSTKTLLVVKNPWVDLILDKKKTWEIRGEATQQRGLIHLALSGAGGRIVGQCHITDSFAIDKDELANHFSKHQISDLSVISYRRPHVWVLSKARRYKKPFVYAHPQGAIKWVKV